MTVITEQPVTNYGSICDAPLEHLPDALYAAVVTGSPHDLYPRIEAVTVMRDSLLRGNVPDPNSLTWPESPIREKIIDWLKETGIANYCKDTQELTDAVVLSILEQVDDTSDRISNEAERILKELLAIEEERRKPKSDGGLSSKQKKPKPLTKKEINKLRNQADEEAQSQVTRDIIEALNNNWSERIRAWAEIEDVFGELGLYCGFGWDMSRSVLKHVGWENIKQLSELIKNLHQVKEIVRTLGRMRTAEEEDKDSTLERLFGPVSRVPEELNELDAPQVPHETRGVERSDNISRMLPSEAVLFNHPTLRLLWHARRAEHTLVTYRVRGVLEDNIMQDENGTEARESEQRKKRLERGPVIVCLDTSGSMQGAPEIVAKAITLEAMRIAHAEKRRCYLFSFSGTHEVKAFNLSLDASCIENLLEFLSYSFHGGTDVTEPIKRALTMLKEKDWRRSDIILVSDGEFSVSNEIQDQISSAKIEAKLRLHGLLIGSYESHAMSELCDPLHIFSDWDALSAGKFPS